MNKSNLVPEPGTVRLERVLPGPIERIWGYLTESEKRARWFAGGPMDLRVGGKVELLFDHRNICDEPLPERYQAMAEGKLVSHGYVTRCEPPRLLSYTWWENEGDKSEITFEMFPEGDEVKLVITHRRLANRKDMLSVCGGWHAHMNILEDRLRGVELRPFWATVADLEKEYDQLLPRDAENN
jgi:uncharacterized protein YndB with AHSA1/START domain